MARWDQHGAVTIIDGPRRVRFCWFLFKSLQIKIRNEREVRIQPLHYYVASEKEYLTIKFDDGHRERFRGVSFKLR